MTTSTFRGNGQILGWNLWKRRNNLHILAFKGYEQKKCIHCGSPITKKNGIVNGRQLYKCHACNKQFLGGERRDPRDILDEYLDGRPIDSLRIGTGVLLAPYSDAWTRPRRSEKTRSRLWQMWWWTPHISVVSWAWWCSRTVLTEQSSWKSMSGAKLSRTMRTASQR